MATSRSFGSRELTTFPSIKTSPLVTFSRPAIILIVVVLPQPEGPNKTKNSSSGIVRLKLSTPTKLPHRFVRFFNSISAIIFLCKLILIN